MKRYAALLRNRAVWSAVLGGLAFASSAPPIDFLVGVVLGLSGLYLAYADATSVGSAIRRAWLWAFAAGLLGMAFIAAVVQRFTELGWPGGVLALVLLSAFQALTWAIGAGLAQSARSRLGLSSRFSFAVLVFVACSLPSVITWTPAALLSPRPELIQFAEMIGERGLSLVIAYGAALLAAPLLGAVTNRERSRRPVYALFAGLGLFAILAAEGAWRLRKVEQELARAPRLELGVVHAAIGAELRWRPEAKTRILSRLRNLTARSERSGAELSIWPEAAYPFVLPHTTVVSPWDERRIVGEGVRGPVLFGLITRSYPGSARYNSASIVEPGGALSKPQAKMALLWFGETVPLSEYLPFLTKVFARSGSLSAGSNVVLLNHGRARIGVLNCYEDTLPSIGRRIALARPNLLVNVTNDAWFGPTAEPELHFRLSVLRAVESRLDLVRAVNLGVPAWIDRAGLVRARGSSDEAGVLRVAPALNDTSPTLYTRAGDIPTWLGIIAIALAAAARTRKRTSLEPASTVKGRVRSPLGMAAPELPLTGRDP